MSDDIENFVKWVSNQKNCSYCNESRLYSGNVFQKPSLYHIFEQGAVCHIVDDKVAIDQWGILPLCDECSGETVDLHKEIIAWFSIINKYRYWTGKCIKSPIELAMLKSMAETLGYDAKFEVKK